MNRFLPSLLLLALLGVIMLVNNSPFSAGQSGTEVKGIIDSNTVWTKANNPYMLTGPILVNNGVTLTIEPGVTVNLGNYYIQVNGTLNARGTVSDNIHFNGGASIMSGAIAFTKFSPSWNEQTEKGSIIENAVISNSSIAISIDATSPEINNNTIYGIIWGAAYTSTGEPLKSSPIITNNNLIAKDGGGSVIEMSTSPIIANNTIRGDIRATSGDAIISGNYIEGSIVSNGEIINNFLFGRDGGNGIQAGFEGIIEHNLIRGYHNAIELGRGASPIIKNNTIINNVNAISVPGYIKSFYSPQIYWNNIYNNSGYSINLYTDETHPTSNINATLNWWGTTNVQTINQAIHDYTDDFNLGTVTFTPFLTAPNPDAPSASNSLLVPTQNPNPTSNTSPSASQVPAATPIQSGTDVGVLFGLGWVGVTVVVLLGVIAVLLVFVVVYLRKRSIAPK